MNWGAAPFVAAFFVLGVILLAVRRPMGRFAHRTYSETGPRSWAKTDEFWTSFTVGSVVILWIVGVVMFVLLVM